MSGDREPLPPVPPTVGDGAGPRRPDALVWACVITWASCAVVLVVLLVSAVLMSTNPDLVIDELRRQGRGVPDADVDLLRTTTFMTVALAGTWSVVAAVVAALAYRGVRRARLALLVSAAAAAVLSLLAVLSTVLALVPGAVCLATVVLLSRPEVRAWSRHGART